MKILVCDPISEEALNILRKEPGFVVEIKTGLSPEELANVIEPYDAIIVRSATKVRKPAIEKGKNLKVIARGGIGLDNIDADFAKSKGIKVLNTPGASTISVAELTLAMMLAISRSLSEADASMKADKWEKKRFEGRELYQKTLGLIGFGNIGKAVGERAKAFGMTVIAYDIIYSPGFHPELGVEIVDIEEIWRRADYISIHTPLTPQTKHLINGETISKMKDGVVIINCARGGIIDENALLEALNSGKVAGAGLDVYEVEPPVGSELVKHPRVIATPHIGASTKEGQDRVGIEIAHKVIGALK